MYEFLRQAAKDQGSQEMEFPVEYMFKNVPGHLPEGADPAEPRVDKDLPWSTASNGRA